MSLAISPNARRQVARSLLSAAFLLCLLGSGMAQASPRVTLVTRLPNSYSGALDAGLTPSSQRLSLTLTLAPSAERKAALDRFLAEVVDPGSKSYRQWVTPARFAASYGATSERIAAATGWLEAQGLSVDAVSAAGTRLTVSGFVARVSAAFAVEMHNYQVAGNLYFANKQQPSLPNEAAAMFLSIEGLDNLPQDLASALGGAVPATTVNGEASSLALPSLAAIVDANETPVLRIDSTFGAGDPAPSRVAAYRALFRQAAAQGMTTLVTRAADSGGIPCGLPEVTVVARVGDNVDASTPFAERPAWQVAQGLPADGLRHAPDLAAASFPDFARTVASIALQNGGRLGNINPVVYELGPVAGVYTQADGAASGTWEPASGLGVVDTAKFGRAYPRGTGTSVLSVTSSSSAPTHGQTFQLSVASQSTNGGPLPTGTVTFTAPQAAFPSSAVTLNGGGMATSPNYLLPGGTYSITATYSGDANYATLTSSITVTVQPEAAVFTITAPATATLGSTIAATVTLSSASGVGTPSASVMVTPSGITGATSITQTVAGTGGTASSMFTFTTKQAGNVSLQATCTSTDPSFTCFTPQNSTTTVPLATPTVALTVTPSNPMAGQQVTLSATVTGVAGIGTTGTVQFFDGASPLGVGSAPGATFIGTLLAGSSHVLTAVYQGDANYVKATSNTVNTSVSTATTTTKVSASATTASYGQSVTLNITVSPAAVVNGTQPTGTLAFTGAGSTTTAAVSGGSANVTLSNLAVGSYTIGTTYSGDSNYASSTGNPVSITVTQSTATLSAQISSTSFTTGSSSTLTVTVTLPGNAQLPSGSTFLATIQGVTGAAYTGTFAINVGGNTGTGSVTIPAPLAGSYTLQVTCATNTNFTCAPSSLSITSTATSTTPVTGTTATTTALAISPALPTAGQTITLTATVSASAAAIAANPLAGMVNFYDGTTLLGSGTIAVVSGVATATATATLTGTTAHSLTAVYQGNTVYAQSTSTAVSVTLSAAGAAVSLSSNVTQTIAGGNVVLTATVSGATTTGSAPTGTVTFYLLTPKPISIGTASLGTTGNGVATAVFSTSNLPDGTLTISATYNGDSNFSSASSNTITIGLSDYSLTFVPQTMTLNRGQTGTATVVVGLVNGFPGQVVLGCTPAPDLAMTCSFNPTVITGGGNSILTVTTTAARTASVEGPQRHSLEAAGGVSLAVLLCWLLPARRRRVPALLLTLLALGITFNSGCGAGGVNTLAAASGGTPLGTTLLEIDTAGTNGSATVRHNYTYQVTIQ